MDFNIGNIFYFLTDKTKPISARYGSIFIAIFLLICADIVTGVSYHFWSHAQLNNLEQIVRMEDSYEMENTTKSYLEQLETTIVKRKHYTERLYFLFAGSSDAQRSMENISQPNKTNAKSSILNIYWMILSSNLSIVLVFFFLIIGILSPKNLKSFKAADISGLAGLTIMLFFWIVIVTIISYQIPVISDSKPYLNYILNLVIHFVFMIIFTYPAIKNRKNMEHKKGPT